MGSNHDIGHGQNRQIDHNYHDMDKIVVHSYMLIIDLFFLLIICKTKKTFNRLVLDHALKFLFIVRASFPRNEGQTPQIRLLVSPGSAQISSQEEKFFP